MQTRGGTDCNALRVLSNAPGPTSSVTACGRATFP